MKILFLGGDKRSIAAYNALKMKCSVDSLGLFCGDSGDIAEADYVVLPVPTTKDGVHIFCPITNKEILLDDVNALKRGAHIITYGTRFDHYPQTDYSKSEDFCIKNSILTAEGAIAHAIQSTDFSLIDSKILIIGFGRVGKALASRLEGFKPDLTVSARSTADFAVLDAMGINRINTADTESKAESFDIIFNTVDVELFGKKSPLDNTFLFDLSTKGCLKGDYMPKNYQKLPGIPGKTAPEAAGKIIADTVSRIIDSNQKK